jgi:diguanylate cyclase (GGDEF)-like protein
MLSARDQGRQARRFLPAPELFIVPADAPAPVRSDISFLGRAIDEAMRQDDTPQMRWRLRESLASALGVSPDGLLKLNYQQTVTALVRLRMLSARIAELEARASADDLTCAMRRGAGIAALGQEIARARRMKVDIVVAFVDVDGLKAVNDRDGHPAGDTVLRIVADTLRQAVRSYDLVIRYGGDEFVCVLFGADLNGATRMLEDIRPSVCEATGGVGISIGFADLRPEDDVDTLLSRADLALYAARRGRGRP